MWVNMFAGGIAGGYAIYMFQQQRYGLVVCLVALFVWHTYLANISRAELYDKPAVKRVRARKQ